MQFSRIVTRVQNITATGSRKTDLVKDSIQTGLYEATAQDLPYLSTDGALELVAPVTTGTVAITNGDKTVTGTGTTFTLAMVGRKIRIAGDNTFYRIASFTSTTSIELENNFLEDTVTTATFSIFKDEYRLPPDLDKYKVLRQVSQQTSLIDIEPTAFDIFEPSPTSEGSPNFSILHGTKLDTDSTGTVAGNAASSTITGTSTTWLTLEGFGRGSIITVETNTFTVKSIESDTSLTIYENIGITFTGQTPTIILDNLIIQLFSIPDDDELIPFKYQRIAYPLVDDQDIPDLPDQWHHILITAGTIWAWATKDKTEASKQEAKFDKQKREMWKAVGHISRAKNIPRRRQTREEGFPLSPPRYDSNIGLPQRIFR